MEPGNVALLSSAATMHPNGSMKLLHTAPQASSDPRLATRIKRPALPVRHTFVIRFVLLALALPLFAENTPLSLTLDGLEYRYNRAKTLQISFEESYVGSGRPRRNETGELSLQKPGKMRWEYSQPAGKLFLSDGKLIYYYNPVSKRAEKMKVRESEDMRAPLAFLLGKLDFQKDFTDFKLKTGWRRQVGDR